MMKKKFIAVVLIGGAFLVSVFIISRPAPQTASFLSVTAPNQNSQNNSNLLYQKNASTDVSSGMVARDGTPTKTQIENLTDSLARLYASQILENNPGGAVSVNGESQIKIPQNITLDGQDLNQIFDTAFSFAPLEEKDIRISNDNSLRAQIAYIESIDGFLKKNFGSFTGSIITALDAFVQKNDARQLTYLTNTIPIYLDDLLKLSVPSRFAALHLDLLNLWQKKLLVYEAILNYKSDALRGYLAMQQIESLGQKDIDLQIVLIKRYQELKS